MIFNQHQLKHVTLLSSFKSFKIAIQVLRGFAFEYMASFAHFLSVPQRSASWDSWSNASYNRRYRSTEQASMFVAFGFDVKMVENFSSMII